MSILQTKLFILASILIPAVASAQPNACLGLFKFPLTRAGSSFIGPDASLPQRLSALIGKDVNLRLSENQILNPSGLASFVKHQTQRLSLLKEIEASWSLKNSEPVQKKIAQAFPDYNLVEINQHLDLNGLQFGIRTIESFLTNHVQDIGVVQGKILSVSSLGIKIQLENGDIRLINFELVRIQIL